MRYVKKSSIAQLALCSLLMGGLSFLSACQMLPGSGANNSATANANGALPDIPAAAQTQFDAALTAQKAQQWPEAEQRLTQLSEQYPQLSGPALNLALLYAQTQRPQLAEENFKRALQINPSNSAAGDQYGVWLRTQGRFDDAEAMYVQTLTRNPAYAATHLNLAILYDVYLGKGSQALEHYQRYLELSSDESGPVRAWVAELQRRLPRAG